MTNAELIQKIRAEIERLVDEYKPTVGGVDELTGAHIILAKLHSFLDTLESGSSEIPNDLEDAAKEYCPDDAYPFGPDIINKEVRKSFIAGAKWQKEQDEKELSDLLTIAHLQGADQMKEQMLKEAVEVQVVGEQRDLRLIDSTQRCLFDAKRGDWLKIIIVKEGQK